MSSLPYYQSAIEIRNHSNKRGQSDIRTVEIKIFMRTCKAMMLNTGRVALESALGSIPGLRSPMLIGLPVPGPYPQY
jgi:hypothetical protein